MRHGQAGTWAARRAPPEPTMSIHTPERTPALPPGVENVSALPGEVARHHAAPFQAAKQHAPWNVQRRLLAALVLTVLLPVLFMAAVLPAFGAVVIEYFNVISSSSAILLEWSTTSEYNTAGFEVLCKGADEPDSAYHRIAYFNARGSVNQGAEYDMLVTNLQPGVPYCFRLHEITTDDEPGESRERCGYGLSITPTPTSPFGTVVVTGVSTVSVGITPTVVLFPAPTGQPVLVTATPSATFDPFAPQPTPTWTEAVDPFATPTWTPPGDPFQSALATPFETLPFETPTFDPFASPTPIGTEPVDPFAQPTPLGETDLGPASAAAAEVAGPLLSDPGAAELAAAELAAAQAQESTPVADLFPTATLDPFLQQSPLEAPAPTAPLTPTVDMAPAVDMTPAADMTATVEAALNAAGAGGAGSAEEPDALALLPGQPTPTPTSLYVVVTAVPTAAGEAPAPLVTPWPTATPAPAFQLAGLMAPTAQNLTVMLLCFIFVSASGLGVLGLITSVLYMRSRSQRDLDELRLRYRRRLP